MPQAEDASSWVHVGVWTNQSKSFLNAATLTITPQSSKVLTSILALLVQMAGSQLWHITQIIVHQKRATLERKDPVYWLFQVVLRNVNTALDSFTLFLGISWAWRHKPNTRSLSRCKYFLLWSFSHITIFILLSTFIATLLDAGGKVLTRSIYCGDYNTSYVAAGGDTRSVGMPNPSVVEWRAYQQTRYSRSQHYFEFCSSLPSGCNDLPRQMIPSSTSVEDQCIFTPNLCLSGVKTIRFDTGPLSSHEDFGINAKRSDQIRYRKVTTCAPLNDTDYITDWLDIPATETSPARRAVKVYLGQNPLVEGNGTYEYPDFAQHYSFSQYLDAPPYQINVQLATAGDTDLSYSDFSPITEIEKVDADLMLAFLSFAKFYNNPVNDPWFSAQKAGQFPLLVGNKTLTGTVYSRQRPVTTLACTEKHQVCNPSLIGGGSDRCTPLTGIVPLYMSPDGIDSLRLNSHQYEVVLRVLQAAIDSRLPKMLAGLSQRDPPLLARRFIQNSVGQGLPDDQWQREAEYWHAMSMVNMQRAVIEYATGQFVPDTSYVNLTASPARKWLCDNQVIRGTNYVSFNFVGVLVVIVLSALVAVMGLCAETALEWAHIKRYPRTPMSRAWMANKMFYMLKVILEKTGRGTWSLPNGVPVCSASETYDIVDVEGLGDAEMSPRSRTASQTNLSNGNVVNGVRGGYMDEPPSQP